MNGKPDILKQVEKQTRKTYGDLTGGKHRITKQSGLTKEMTNEELMEMAILELNEKLRVKRQRRKRR